MLKSLMAIAAAIPFLVFFIPSSVINRFASIGDLGDSSTFYRVYCWRGSIEAIKDHFLGGIGYGTDAFKAIYPQYAFAGIEAAEHSHSLFLQILVAMGIGGLLTFLALVFLYFQKCAEYIKKPEDVRSKFYVAAALSSVIAMLIMGVFDYVWFNYRVFYVFWIVIAIGCAFVRVGNTEAERQNLPIDEMGSADRDYK
jgi:putative inorganic carbon (HCO3(-)) transporter